MNPVMREMYEQVILDHNRRPRQFQHVPEPVTHQSHGENPICGDEFTVRLKVQDGVIQDMGFDGAGCAISTASTSMMVEAVKGKTLAEAEALFQRMRHLLTGTDAEAAKQVGKLRVLQGVHDYPMRVKCATLGWHVLHAALAGAEETVSTEDEANIPEQCRIDDRPPA